MGDPDSLLNIALVVALIVGVFAILAGVDKALAWGTKRPAAARVVTPPPTDPTCPSCGQANPAGAVYCSSCGGVFGGACASCGAERPPGSRFCRTCGEAFRAPAGGVASGLGLPAPVPLPVNAPVTTQMIIPARSWFGHGLLVGVTLGFWFPVWFGLSWRDAKRAAGVEGMPAFWHGLLALVPLVNLWRMAVHFRTIRGARLARGLRPSLPGWGAVLVALALPTVIGVAEAVAVEAGYVTSRQEVAIIRLVGLTTLMWIVVAGQQSLNVVAQKDRN